MALSWLHRFWNHVVSAPIAAQIFTLIAVVVWCSISYSAMKRANHFRLALVIATLYCFVAEYLAIRLGKYHYAEFPLSIPEFEFAWLERSLAWASRHGIIPEIIQVHDHVSKHIPLEVALLEAAMLYGVFRITNFLSPQPPRGEFSWSSIVPWLHARWPNPVLNGALAISIDAMLDPLVSKTMAQEGGPVAPGLGLWTWHTTAHYAGHWFGIPLANYNAWFAALFAFTIATRISGTQLSIAGTSVKSDESILVAGLHSVLKLIGLLFVVKFSLDRLTYEVFNPGGQPTPAAWQFAISGALVAGGIVAALIIARRARRTAAFEWVTVAPIIVIFVFGAGALWLGGIYKINGWLFPLWIITAAIAIIHGSAPWRRQRGVGLEPEVVR